MLLGGKENVAIHGQEKTCCKIDGAAHYLGKFSLLGVTENSDYCFEHLIKILACIIHENMYSSGISPVVFLPDNACMHIVHVKKC